MKTTKFKKFMALLLTGMMTLSMFSGVALADESDGGSGYTPTNPYIINLGGAENLGDYDASQSSLYVSPYCGYMSYPRVDVDPSAWEAGVRTYGTVQELYNLINVNVLNSIPSGQRAGEGAYASIPAYCTDASVGARAGYQYQRLNLEDSSYYPEGVAEHIRAIMWKSFPHITDMDFIANAVNAWLDANGAEHVDVAQLTPEEALQATQLAIWELAGGDDVTVRNVFYDWYGDGSYAWRYTDEELEDWVYYTDEYSLVYPYAKKDVNTENNVRMLFAYLMDLEGMEPQTVVVSEIAFTSKDMTVAINADNTYNVTVNAVVDVTIGENDELTLTAILGNEAKSVALKNGTNTFEHTFKSVASLADVQLAIDGYQTGEDAYFFTGEERITTQSMVAFDATRMPVHADTTIDVDRIINFTKTTAIANADGTTNVYPLEGIEFEIYYAGTVDEYTQWIQKNGKDVVTETVVDGKRVVTVDADYAAAAKAKGLITTVKTDATGKASYNITDAEQPDGMYLIVEKEHPAIVEALPAFLVAVPTTSVDGTGLTYTINLQPKNELWPGPEVEKNINEIGKDLDSVAAGIGATHTWIIRGDIPVDIANGKSYVLTDTMDYRLTYQGNVRVAIEKEGEESVPLTEGTHYDLTVGKSKVMVGEGENQVEEVIDILKIELTEAGMDEAAKYQGYEVRVYFDAIIDEDAAAATLIPNDVTLDYENSVGIEFFDEADAEVFTCAIEVLKHDAKDESNLLAGAVFKVAKEAVTAEELAEAVTLVVDRSTSIKVVYVDFYNTDAIDETTLKVDFVETSAEESKKGEAMIYGLAAGEYYLVETKAPAGYNLLSYPIKVTVGTGVDAEQNVVLSEAEAIREVKVANSNTFVLPETGGIGTVIFTVSGGLMTLAGGAILTLKKREEE